MDIGILNRVLKTVEKPSRYTGGELNMRVKDLCRENGDKRFRFALCFPDVYEIGMSHLGSRIIYNVLNERDDTYCERSFAPWFDMETAMRENGIPMFSLETHSELKEFDIIGFSLLYEMCYTNILTMLDLAGIPL
ncbi:MAG: B12-binding domain-containing radical SAM protein, partial [Clostridia bacterium]|nr:B12-binding domain-containing radical SAM protein [Clostridia bacterium]